MMKNKKLAFPTKWSSRNKQSFWTLKEHLREKDRIVVEVISKHTPNDQP